MIDFTVALSDLDGVAISDGSDAKASFTLGAAAVRALVISYEDERNLSAEEKFKRGELATRIHGATKLSLKAEDVTLLKKLIGKAYGPLIVFRAWPLLDAAEAPGKE
ncbi:MAG: hypothetical protein JO228_15380 [Xanthobacteraceae bacterium]|nr:hypothetical protein [Xanthobacteraceae bacterium]